MPPEAELLLACARVDLDDAGRERMRAIVRKEIDWPRFLCLAGRHGLLPLLHRHLQSGCDGAVPRRILADLWARQEILARRNRVMARELSNLLRGFEEGGIEAIPFKGPAIAAQLYGDVTLREYGDLDILVRRRDVPRAMAALRSRGYASEYHLSPAIERAVTRSSGQNVFALTHPTLPVVELHWRTDRDLAIERGDDDAWWAELASSPLEGGRVRCFGDEELLLILCVHGSKHHWSALGWLVDIAELLRQKPRLDWNRIERLAARLGCGRRLALGLHLARTVLDAPLPPDGESRALPRSDLGRLAGRIEARFFEAGYHGPGPVEALRSNLLLCDRPRDRVHYLFNTFLVPGIAECSRWPLPRALSFLYPAVRLMSLSRRYLLR